MLKGLFIPKVIKDKIYHFKIGYQNLLIFEFNKYKEELIINKNHQAEKRDIDDWCYISRW